MPMGGYFVMKKCKTCNEIKDMNDFEIRKNCKDGRAGTCRVCRNEKRKIHKCTCNNCGSEFMSAKTNSKFCSQTCTGNSKQVKIEVKCIYCNSSKLVVPSIAKKLDFHYCNQRCRTNHLKEIMVGEKNPNYNKVKYWCDGCNNTILVVPSRIEKQKNVFCTNECYKKNIGKFYSRENNSNWNFALSKQERDHTRRYPEYYEWRNKVYEKDNFTCCKCGDDKGGNLIAHHMYNYSKYKELRTVLGNGITLCTVCHKDFHGIYGYKNNNKLQVIEFLK